MRRSKYNNVRIEGFDSKAEYARWNELKILERAGHITNLRRQVKFPLAIGPMLITKYIADFCYNETKTGHEVVEDTKGYITDLFRVKRKLMLALWGIDVKIVKMRRTR